MAYQKFTIKQLKKQFGLQFVERREPVLDFQAVEPSPFLVSTIDRNLDLALTVGTEKIRSELLVAPLLVELRESLHRQIAVFSGKEFNADEDAGLNGYCDFLISRSPELLDISAPVLVIVEAKQDNLNGGIPQCVAEMVGAQFFNQQQNASILTIYGAVTTGNLWKFLKLQDQIVTIGLVEYAIPPVDQVLGILMQMVMD